MRVLFVGDGPHDVGRDVESMGAPFEGVVQMLARRLCPHIAKDSPARHWKTIPLFSTKREHVVSRKLKAAALVAERTYDCAALVAVIDRDNDDARTAALRDACAQVHAPELPVVGGVAVNSIEAWTLGAPTALASALGVTPGQLTKKYQPGRVEALYQNSDEAAKRPKDLLMRLAQEFAHRPDGIQLRQEVAALTDVTELERHCPGGFAPFAAALRERLPPT
ncbi:MAG: hypothetical protein Q8S73_00720 [Deltaproteobacteria bacterium]|nr:hypothetical protein [Myxococcales bacterium]MDP3212596.1 hypothetical protein [Deltaproteobacteria bacterium]